jgi:probable rRNA maturation factor
LEISIKNDQNDLEINSKSVVEVVKNVLALENAQCDLVTIHFVNKQRISDLHQDFFNDPTSTDCITFPMDAANSAFPCILGEVFVCPLVAKEYILENHLKDPCIYKEVTLYVVHGILHLLGYLDDHENIAQMREKEAIHMENLVKKSSRIHP